MPIIEPKRVCIVTRGADAGKEVVVKEIIDKNFTTIVGKDVKERRINIVHLEPTGRISEIPEGKPVKVKKKTEELVERKKEEKIVEKIIKQAQEG
jgi:ribosomal protein L14E/L6E/L27E